MTWAELERRVKKAGWRKGDDGGRHAYIYHPDNPKNKIPFGRHPSQEAAPRPCFQIDKLHKRW